MSNVANSANMKAMSGRRIALLLLVLLGIALFFLAAPLFIVFVIGMVPTVVAFVCDRDREKFSAIAIGAGNLAGVVPFLISLAIDGPTLARARQAVTDVFTLAVMCGGAGAGWLVVTVLPSVVAVYMNVMTEARIQRLRKHQRTLVEEWGNEVARADKPEEKSAAKRTG
jgi:hypothetical protein